VKNNYCISASVITLSPLDLQRAIGELVIAMKSFSPSLSLSLSLFVCMYIYVYTQMYIQYASLT
jgi:hypothetical protein